MNSRKVILLVSTIILVFTTVYAVVNFRPSSAPISSITLGGEGPQIGKSAPNFELPLLESSKLGKNISLSSFKGTPLILNFFASWCSECAQELPLLSSFAKSNSSTIKVIGIDSGDSPTNASRLLAKDGAHFTVLSDEDESLISSSYSSRGLPYSVLISKNGTVLSTNLGSLNQNVLAQWKKEASVN